MKPKNYMKLIIPSVLALIAVGVGFSIFKSNEGVESGAGLASISPQSTKQTQPANTKTLDYSTIEDASSFVDTVADRLSLISQRSDLSVYDETQISAAINDPRIWDLSTQASPDGLPIDDTEKNDGRVFFKANPARVAVSLPGDVLEIALPDLGEPLLLEVDNVGSSKGGLVSLSGVIGGDEGTFNMTQGEGLIAGHINTSTNTYSFEIFGETGWIHESGALFTGELPPVFDSDHAAEHSPLGSQGERIIAKGNSEKEGALDAKTTTNTAIEE